MYLKVELADNDWNKLSRRVKDILFASGKFAPSMTTVSESIEGSNPVEFFDVVYVEVEDGTMEKFCDNFLLTPTGQELGTNVLDEPWKPLG